MEGDLRTDEFSKQLSQSIEEISCVCLLWVCCVFQSLAAPVFNLKSVSFSLGGKWEGGTFQSLDVSSK